MTRPTIFLGPSLGLTDAQGLLDADYRPPAGQGDLYRAALQRPCAIGLIDGVFRDAPTVRHREILWAMAQGIPVFGASSMGALRAAEMAGAGMIGVGLIFRWYRRFALLPDDAVAVTHGPHELGSPPLSDALVDIRRSLSAARRAGAIPEAAVQAALAAERRKPFAERRLGAQFAPFRVRQKAEDAQALLRRMADHARAARWPEVTVPEPPVVHAWLDDLRASGLAPPRATGSA